jgi:hypothetical protein
LPFQNTNKSYEDKMSSRKNDNWGAETDKKTCEMNAIHVGRIPDYFI